MHFDLRLSKIIKAKRSLTGTAYYFLKRVAKRLICNNFWFYILYPINHQIIESDIESSYKTLQNYSSRPKGKSLINNEIVRPFKYDLQIIIPVFNVEKYLNECIDSILKQKTKYSYQIIIINDASTDTSFQIAEEYSKHERIKVIHHRKNKGLSCARNTGLKRIEGKYITFVDSDDLLVDGALDTLLDVALKEDADIVQGEYYVLFERSHIPNTMKEKNSDTTQHLYGQSWGKVYRSQLFNNLGFPEGYLFEDTINSFLVFPQAKKIVLIPDYVYEYRQHQNSIIHTYREIPKSIDSFWITELLINEHEEIGLPRTEDYYEKILNQIVINGKRAMNTPLNIQKSIFSLTVELIHRNFPLDFISKKNRHLEQALLKNDFGVYRLYCKLH